MKTFKWVFFFGYIFVSRILSKYFCEEAHVFYNDEILEESNDHNLIVDTITMYYEVNAISDKDTVEEFRKIMTLVAGGFQKLCQMYQNDHSNIGFDLSKCLEDNPCDIMENVMNLRNVIEHSADKKSKLQQIQSAFQRSFSDKSYINMAHRLAIHEMAISEKLDEIVGNLENYVGNEYNLTYIYEFSLDGIEKDFISEDLIEGMEYNPSTELVKTSITQVLMNANGINACLHKMIHPIVKGMVNNQCQYDQKMTEYDNDKNDSGPDHLNKVKRLVEDSNKNFLSHTVNLRKMLQISMLKLITFLCVKNSWMKFVYSISEIYIFLALWNICVMFIFYRYSSLPFAVISLIHAAYCKLYKQVFGCSCKIINSFWTFALLQKYHEELEMKRKRKCRVKRRVKIH